MRARPALAVIVGTGALLAAGCGGGGGSSTTSAADWASGYCSAAETWVTSLAEARASVAPGDPSATASDAAQQMTDATNTFTQSIDGLGEPDTAAGSTSKATAKSLSETLQGRVARASAAIDTNNADVTEVQRAKVVSEQVTASLTAVTTTTAQLAKDDAEVGTAMAASSSCADLTTALSKAG